MSDKPLVSAEEMASVLSDEGSEPAAPDVTTGPESTAGPSSDRYSLRRPLVIAPEDEPAAQKRLATMTQQVGKALSSMLDAEIEIEMHGFQQQQVRSAIDRLSGKPWVQAFGCDGEGGGVVLGLDAGSALAIIELALGGSGTYTAEGRPPTALETRVMNQLTRKLSAELSRRMELTFASQGFRTGSAPRDVVSPGEMVGAALLRIRISGSEKNGLLLVSPNLLRKEEQEDAPHPPGELGPLVQPLLDVALATRPVLPAGIVTLQDICDLKVGSVLSLDASADRRLELRVGGIPLFSGEIASDEGGAKGFRILRGGSAPHNAEQKEEEVA